MNDIAKQNQGSKSISKSVSVPASSPTQVQHKKPWLPLDNYNAVYANRQRGPSIDFIAENVAKVHARSIENSMIEKPLYVREDTDLAHNYSICNKNSAEAAKRAIREISASNRELIYSYSKSYNHGTVPHALPEEAEKRTREESRRKWRTDGGFVTTFMKTALESNKCNIGLHESRIEELHEPWEENRLNSCKVKPSVDWKKFSWNDRRNDFRFPRRIETAPPPTTIHLQGEKREAELKEFKNKENLIWKNKVVVDNTDFRVHRTNTNIELKERGFEASSQTDKLGCLLKDRPQKLALSAPGFKLSPIPAIDVIKYPGDRTESKVFKPGDDTTRSWSRKASTIPVVKEKPDLNNRFKLYILPHEYLSSIPIKPITKEEKTGHLWEATPS